MDLLLFSFFFFLLLKGVTFGSNENAHGLPQVLIENPEKLREEWLRVL